MADEPTTLAALIEAQAKALGEKPFLHFEDRVVSFAELNRQVNRAANGLTGLGVKAGVGVSIMMPNSPEWLFVYFATQKLGAYAVPVNVGLKGEGLRHVVDHSDSSVLICHPDYLEAIQAIRGSLSKLEQIVVECHRRRRRDWKPPEGWRALAGLMQASDANPAGEDRRGGDLRAHVHLRHHRPAQGRGQPLPGHDHRRAFDARRCPGARRRALHLPAALPRQRALPDHGAGAGHGPAAGALAPLLRQPLLGRDPALRRHHLQRAGGDDPHPDEAARAPRRR